MRRHKQSYIEPQLVRVADWAFVFVSRQIHHLPGFDELPNFLPSHLPHYRASRIHDSLNFFLRFMSVVPFNGLSQPVSEGDLRCPAQKFLGKRVVGHAVLWPGGHVR